MTTPTTPTTPTTATAPVTTIQDGVEKDEWGNTIYRDKKGDIIAVSLQDLRGSVDASGYAAYRYAKQTAEGERLAGTATGFYERLTPELPSAEGVTGLPNLPSNVPPFVTEDWFTTSPDALQKMYVQQWQEAQGVAGAGVGEGAGAAGAAVVAPLFSPDEERLMKDLENAVSVGQLDEDQAWKVIENYWTEEKARQGRVETATTRGTELLGGALPSATLPMTGPGGMSEILSKRYGIPDIMPGGFPGLPMERALGVYGQAQEQMGLPATLPPVQQPNIQLPNWGAFMQNMPTFGGGNKYIDELLKEGRSTAPNLG